MRLPLSAVDIHLFRTGAKHFSAVKNKTTKRRTKKQQQPSNPPLVVTTVSYQNLIVI